MTPDDPGGSGDSLTHEGVRGGPSRGRLRVTADVVRLTADCPPFALAAVARAIPRARVSFDLIFVIRNTSKPARWDHLTGPALALALLVKTEDKKA